MKLTKFLYENESGASLWANFSADELANRDIKNALDVISKKAANNKVGLARFAYSDHNHQRNYCEIYVLPKIFAKTDSSSAEQIQRFNNYVAHYFRLWQKYPQYKNYFELPKALGSLVNPLLANGGMSANDLLLVCYLTPLQEIHQFFAQHRAEIKRSVNLAHQAVRYKLDLRRNVIEVNKSHIHQIKHEQLYYSTLAALAFAVLAKFELKIKHLSQMYAYGELSKHVLNILSHEILKLRQLLKSKFKPELQSISLALLQQQKVRKLFTSPTEQKLWRNLLFLLCSMGNKDEIGSAAQVSQDTELMMLFFAPETFYELICYDDCAAQYGNAQVRFKDETFLNHQVLSVVDGNQVATLKSQPDIVVETEDETLIIDAKWKILESFDFTDVAKLQRDYLVYRKTNPEKAKITNILCYPKVKQKCTEYIDHAYKLDYDSSGFQFVIKQYMIELE